VRAAELATVNGRSLPFDICIWAACMRASPIARQAGLEVDAQDRIMVGPDLRSIAQRCVSKNCRESVPVFILRDACWPMRLEG
jgi:NADH dehydrogenase